MSLLANDVGHLFTCLSLYIFFGKMFKLLSIFYLITYLLVVEFGEFFIQSGYESFIRYWQIFSPIL